MHSARRWAWAAAAPEGDLSRPATKDDLLTTGVLKDELRAFSADIKRALILQTVVVSTVGLSTPLLRVLLR